MITCFFEKGAKAQLRHVVVHAILEKDNKLLLVKRAGDLLETGKWSLPSGYLSRDETAAEGILRELKEETGIDGEIVKLFRINTNPYRPQEDRQNIALEFIINPLSDIGTRDVENSKVEWVPFEKLLPLNEFAFDHGETIKLYLKHRKNKFSLPLVV